MAIAMSTFNTIRITQWTQRSTLWRRRTILC
jgi:hypothetical protein